MENSWVKFEKLHGNSVLNYKKLCDLFCRQNMSLVKYSNAKYIEKVMDVHVVIMFVILQNIISKITNKCYV